VSVAPLLEMRGIDKEFLGVRVLEGNDLDCDRGEIHPIVGENGAGKTTLMKILAGAYTPNAGEVRLDGAPVHFGHPLEAQHAGVSIIYQEFNLLPDRTVAENVFLGREPKRGPLVDRKGMEAQTERLLAELAPEDPISPRQLVGSLPVARQQTVETAAAIWRPLAASPDELAADGLRFLRASRRRVTSLVVPGVPKASVDDGEPARRGRISAAPPSRCRPDR
jgi:ribose transport system ATP-binding protein